MKTNKKMGTKEQIKNYLIDCLGYSEDDL